MKSYKRDFYYSNLYDDVNKQKSMPMNVGKDLEPFNRYLEASKEALEKSSQQGADVVVLEDETENVLIPQFSIIKHENSIGVTEIVCEIPQCMYMLKIDKEDAELDLSTFVVTKGRSHEICSLENKVDFYDGTLFLEIKETEAVPTDEELSLWDAKEHHFDCRLLPVDFCKCGEYRIRTEPRIEIKKCRIAEGKLVLTAEQRFSAESIEICGKSVSCNSREITGHQPVFERKHTANAVSGCFVVEPCFENNERIPQGFRILNEKEVYDFICENTDSVKEQTDFLNGQIIFKGNETNTDSFVPFSFHIKESRIQLKKRQFGKDGILIELKEDETTLKDLTSNIDIFFAEQTEKLVDFLGRKKGGCRTFTIGARDENSCRMEITEIINNKQVKPKDLPSHLYAVPNTWQLEQSGNAIYKIWNMPVKEHRRFIELFEKKEKADWNFHRECEPEKWYVLDDATRDGCQEQREFVKKALATPDFAFLDGPPGSGKTTVILELAAQLISQGKKVLMSASTNAAVDNVLERISDLKDEKIKEKIFAVRLGSSMSEKSRDFDVSGLDEDTRNEIIYRANFVCGTIFGILHHPEFNLNDKRSQPATPLYDCLIIDEASKTTFQDFLVPALYAKKWILSGDLKQLTPYIEQESIEAAVRSGIEGFNEDYQLVQTLFNLARENLGKSKEKPPMHFYYVCTRAQITAAQTLIQGEMGKQGTPANLFGIVCNSEAQVSDTQYCVCPQEIETGNIRASIFYGARFLFIEESCLSKISSYLPANCISCIGHVASKDKKNTPILFLDSLEAGFFLPKRKVCIELGSDKNRSDCKTRDEIHTYWERAIKEREWAKEITWRMCRIEELFQTKEDDEKGTKAFLQKQIEQLLPVHKDLRKNIEAHLASIRGIALPSILRLLQQGVEEKSLVTNRYETTLQNGFKPEDFDKRHVLLKYQHRMHPDISRFSASNIYNGEALQDGKEMVENRKWNCQLFQKRNVCIDVKGNGDCRNENRAEINVIFKSIEKFFCWAKDNKKENGEKWSVAVLTYYKKQERLLKQKLKTLFKDKNGQPEQREKANYVNDFAELMIYTIDKFQGREADVVYLSLIKSGDVSIGFMDSQNRLNVALTRAKYQRIVVCDRLYFTNAKTKGKAPLFYKLMEQDVVMEAKK